MIQFLTSLEEFTGKHLSKHGFQKVLFFVETGGLNLRSDGSRLVLGQSES